MEPEMRGRVKKKKKIRINKQNKWVEKFREVGKKKKLEEYLRDGLRWEGKVKGKTKDRDKNRRNRTKRVKKEN